MYISKIKLDKTNTTYDIKGARTTYFGTCTTAAATAAKEISVALDSGESFLLRKGTTIIVQFSYTNTASNPTFAVASNAAASVSYNGATITTSNLAYAGNSTALQTYVYDGTNWVYTGKDKDNNTTYSALTEADAKTGTATTARSITAEVLSKTAKGYVTTVSGATPAQTTLTPGIHYVFSGDTTNYRTNSLSILFGTVVSDVINEYSFEFNCPSGSATTLTVPNTLKWIGAGTTPTITKNKHYEINVKYNPNTQKYYALCSEWPIS